MNIKSKIKDSQKLAKSEEFYDRNSITNFVIPGSQFITKNEDKIKTKVKSEPSIFHSAIKTEDMKSENTEIKSNLFSNIIIKQGDSLLVREIKIEVQSNEIEGNSQDDRNSSQFLHDSALKLSEIKQETPLQDTNNSETTKHENSSILQEIKEEEPLEISEPTSNDEISFHKCSQCDETFEFKSMLISHQMSHFEKVKCKKCSKNIFKHKLEEHEKSHDSQWDLKCEICERVFTEKATKKRHMLTHSDKKLYTCRICGKGFNDRRHYRDHEKNHENPRPFKCDECSVGFNRKCHLLQHKLRIHGTNQIHNCQHCDFSSTSYTELSTHKLTHRQKQKCPHCEKLFPEATKLKVHILAVHVKSYDYKCDICDEAFTSPLYMKRHKKDKHSETVKHKCSVCQKPFSSEANLTNHFKKYHKIKSE